MAEFPTGLDTFTDFDSSLSLGANSHSSRHNVAQDAIAALEAKVGVDSSAVGTSLDYLLKSSSSASPGHTHVITEIGSITASAAEINILDGVTATTSELNILDGVTATASEINQLDDVVFGGTDSDDVVTIGGTQTLTNKTLSSPTFTNPVLNGNLSGTGFLDEDDLASNSATAAASQQSIKAYVDSFVADGGGNVIGSETSTNNAIVRFNGASGRTIQDSSVTIDDSGSVNIPLGQAYKVGGSAVIDQDVSSGSSPTFDAANITGLPSSGLDAGVGIADDNLVEIDDTDAADNDYAKLTANGLEGRSYSEVRTDLGLVIGTDVLAEQTIGIADDNLLEVDGSPNSAEYARFTANGLEGRTEAEFKGDFNLEIGTDVLAQQTIGIANDNLVEVDDADAADNDYAKFTVNGLEGRSYAQVKSDLNLEIGTDVLAQQTIGIANDNLVEVDDADAADNDYAKFTVNGLEGRSYAEVKTDLGLTEDGWTPDSDTWVYVSATSFKIAGKDVTSKFTKGTKVSYNDGSVDYGIVASSAFSTDTTVTLVANSDYAVANAALSAPRYSYVENPQGFPNWKENACALATMGSAQTPADGVIINFDTCAAGDNPGSYFDTTDKEFDVPVTGWYEISAAVAYGGPTSGVRYGYHIKNNATFLQTFRDYAANTSTVYIGGSKLMRLTAGDEIGIYCAGGGLGLDTTDSVTYFSIKFISI